MPIQLIESENRELLLSFLRDADASEARIIAALESPMNTAYLVTSNGEEIGGAIMHWDAGESELVYIGVANDHRGRGHGKAIISQILTQARHRKTKSLIVGTANSSLENIAFYQKCGFRVDHVRKDHFDYFEKPVHEHGIRIRDMLVFRYDL